MSGGNSRWVPLESNPEVLNKFLEGLGVPAKAQVCDVLALDEPLLAMVPKPAYALLLLYPLTSKAEAFQAEEEAKVSAAGQELPADLYYMKQFIGNACGAVALIHALANNSEKIDCGSGTLKEFLEKTKGMSPEERGEALQSDDSISSIHQSCADDGQTAAPNRDDKLDTHFIAFVNVGGSLYELDGRKKFPICHGATSDDSFLEDGAKILKGFMQRDPEETRFAVLALAAAE